MTTERAQDDQMNAIGVTALHLDLLLSKKWGDVTLPYFTISNTRKPLKLLPLK